MATASPVQLSAVSARPNLNPQFSQSRGGTNANSSNATTSNPHVFTTTTTTTTPNTASIKPQDTAHMLQAPQTSSAQSAQRAPPVTVSRAVIGSNHVPNNSPGVNQLELVELSSNALIEGVLGPNRDGRVRNPVPSKLKGKTDNKQGNFGVMHMGTSPGKKAEAQGRDSAAERDAAARRTSENTASRAKAAQQERYVPPKKRGLDAGAEMGNRGSPFAVSKNDDRSRARPLAPDETKFEQARLLTLLRSINPVTVVDQICKAIAYFGGIPGAPPPEDGIFPESANTRETGALFIGWVAEIFPDVASRSPEVPIKEPPGPSKKKSRPSASKKGVELPNSEPPNSRNGFGFGPAVAAPAWGLPQSLEMVNPSIPAPTTGIVAGAQDSVGYEMQVNAASGVAPKPGTPTKAQTQGADGDASSKKRRGRPKGSMNKRGKDGGEGDAAPKDTDVALGDSVIDPQLQSISQAGSNPPANSYAPGYPNPTDQSNVQKPAQPYQYPLQNWSNQQKSQTGLELPQADELSPQERAILEAFRHQGVDSTTTSAPAPVAPMGGPVRDVADAGGAKKRKRAPAKPKASATAATAIPAPPITDSSSTMASAQNIQGSGNLQVANAHAVPQVQDQAQWPSKSTTTPILPPAKKPRVRKPKVAASTKDSPARTQTASVASASTPILPPSTIPEPQVAAPQPTTSTSRPPAEGLEAHYERFASLQQQGGRSNTPTHPQHQRQQSKPGSVPSQQTTPQIQHQQVQMQQQKSQQGALSGTPKDDQKVSQTSANIRPTSTNFYNPQRNQSASYSQQYQSTASQLYAGHQSSPQLSNANTLTNSTSILNGNALSSAATPNNNYARAYASNPLSQVSPQFGQHDTSYRTASPHTIAQPTPSYANNDNSFRTNSHNLSQPTSTYSQTDSAYRAPTTHTLAQPSTSYASARTHAQPSTTHQNQYNHFSDSSFLDLPTLDSLGHSGNNSSSSNVGIGVAGFGQGLNMGHSTSRSGSSSNLYSSTSGLSHTYDNSSNDMLRGVARSSSNTNTGGYGSNTSDMGYFHKRV